MYETIITVKIINMSNNPPRIPCIFLLIGRIIVRIAYTGYALDIF